MSISINASSCYWVDYVNEIEAAGYGPVSLAAKWRFYDVCRVYIERFGQVPSHDMYEILWHRSQKGQ